MPLYKYSARTQPKKTIEGTIEAESKQDAIDKLARLGHFPISVEPGEDPLDVRADWFLGRRVGPKDIALFTSQLSSLTESGINIIKSLSLLSGQLPNRHLRACLKDLIKKIKDGRSLSESLSSHPKIFSNFYVALVRAGEVGGNLDVSLKRLSGFLKTQEDFKNSLKTALIYPFFIFVLSVVTVAVLLGFVIPRLSSMFEDMGQMLPWPTKVLLQVSEDVSSYWWMMAALLLFFFLFARRIYRTPRGRAAFDRLRLKLPIWGEVVLKSEISRLFRTLSLLLSSGVHIVPALNVAVSVIENRILKAAVEKAKEVIAKGASFSRAIGESPFFPLLVVNIMTVAEETGTLEKSLLRVADEYERDVDAASEALSHLLEPLIILGMGLIVGFIVLAMLLPIFQINLMAV